MTQRLLALAALLCSFLSSSAADIPIFPTNATWRYLPGQNEASSPVSAWRSNGFDAVSFTVAPAPFSYGEGYSTGTIISGMQNSYTCFFLRREFVLTNLAEIAGLRLGALVDDGFVVWINGTELQRVNVPGAPGDAVTITTLANNATEPVQFTYYSFGSPGHYLVAGTNVIAVQVFNTSLGSSDIVFNASLDAVLADTNPPVIVSVTPAPGSTLTSLTQITVQFSEAITGLSADDLNVHGVGATGLSGDGTTFTFTFSPAPYGEVPITWVAGHGLVDFGLPPNSFNENGPGATWSYTLVDDVPPAVASIFPPANASIRILSEVEVTFTEPVHGLEAADLLMNGQPASAVIEQPGATYIFQFAAAADGPVTLAWAAGHGITDLTSNAFPGGSWNYTVNASAAVPAIIINEINAANQSGLLDEDGENQDWIELLNSGATPVNLAGWSLSDDPDLPGQWVFPARTLAPGEYLVVFCSGKDRKFPTGTNRFHTGFSLGSDGEFLGLYTPDSPRQLASGFDYPEQRNDISYGRDAGAQLRYFATPTPGTENGTSTITGVVTEVYFSASRGFVNQPFPLVLSCATKNATIRYTTNGSEPTLVNGLTYEGQLNVSASLFIRAAAFAPDKLPSGIETHSYLFNQPATIRSLPVISIQTAEDNLTGPTGIIGMQGGTGPPNNPWTAVNPGDYHNTTKKGIAWERPISVELIQPGDNSDFQTDCGIRVQGSDWTRPRYTPTSKFSYRLYFRGEYGPGRLEYPIFPDSVVANFDQIVLRAGHNDISNPFLRDELTRQLHADMGQAASHGRYVNFFLNGVYKGYYNPCERIEESFLQNWHGGGDSWDIITVGSVVQGGDNVFWNSMRSYINAQDVTQPAVFTEVMRRLDATNFIDYLILNVYAATWDWPHNNWRAARERSPTGKFRFYIWDAEGAYGHTGRDPATFDSFSTTDSGLLTAGAEIPVLYQRLRNSPEFRLIWADRVHKHFFNGGALMESNVLSRFLEQRTELQTVIPGFNNSIQTSWVPLRRNPLMAQFNLYGLLASSNAPFFNQHGGNVAPGFNLTMTATNVGGTIYYTTNGEDPRVSFTGAVAPAAVAYAGPVALQQSTLVKARTLNNGNWSALAEANFTVGFRGVPLRITEINYNPIGGGAYEFLELQNIGSTPVNLSGMYFDGITFVFPEFSTLAAGARLVLASAASPEAFAVRYPSVAVAGYYSGSLDNAGERIVLRLPDGNVVTSLDYDDASPWPTSADGAGYSIEMMDLFGNPDDPANWRASAEISGTPGAANTPVVTGSIRLNEVLALNASAVNHGGTFPGFVELANTSDTAVDVSGWSVSDDGNPRKFVFPPASTISANGFLVLWCDASTNTTPGLHTGFILNPASESLFLYDANTNVVDALSWGQQAANYSLGRLGVNWELNSPTPDAVNTAATLGSAASVSINEFLANPPAGQPDWLELFNNSALPVALRGTFLASTASVHRLTALSFLPPYGFIQLFANEGPGANQLDFKLSAAGGAIVFHDTAGNEVNRLNYTAQLEGVTRGRLPDGSATIVNFPGTASPGASNYTATYAGAVLNEVLARNVAAVTHLDRAPDYVELFNPTASAFSLAGMSLSVDSASPGEWTFPPGASLAPNGYLVIWCDNTRPASTNFGDYNTGRALNGNSGGAYLFNTAGQLVNSVEYGFQVSDRSIGLVGGVWRLLAAPTPGAANGAVSALAANTGLRFNEWLANSANGPDWFELFNPASEAVDLGNLVLTDDPTLSGTNGFRIPPLSFIGASNFVQFIADAEPEQGRDHASFRLDELGDTLRLYTANASNIIHTVVFGAQTFGVSQGYLPDGATNNVLSFSGSPTPGESNYRLIGEVVINEVLSHAVLPIEPMIELHNPTPDMQHIGGWFLSDSAGQLKKLRFADDTTIAPGGFVTVSDAQFGTGPNAFTLDRARGGEVWLSAADLLGNLTGFRTRVRFGAADENVSFGRYAVAGRIDFPSQSTFTPGATNSGPVVGPVVINEIMYNPPGSNPGAREFLELRNVSSGNVDLFDPARPTNTWRISGGIEYVLPQGITLAPGEYVLLVDFDPVNDPVTLFHFRNHYGVPPAALVHGPYLGRLNNGGDTVELSRPTLPAGAFLPYVLVEKVEFDNSAPWPTGAVDGGGHSLQRRTGNAYANTPENWLAAVPTPGAATGTNAVAPPVITLSPRSTNVLANANLVLEAAATGAGPIEWQWRFNGVELAGATNAWLSLEYLQPGESGVYDVYARNAGGSRFAAPAQVSVIRAPFVVSTPPAFYDTTPGNHVALVVSADGTQPLSYQWQRDGVNIPGAVSPGLSVSNVNLYSSGVYSLAISNRYGWTNVVVTLRVLIAPVITNAPTPQVVLQGGTAIFTVVAGPHHPVVPLGYRWVRNFGILPPVFTSEPYLVWSNVQANGQVRVIVTNASGSSAQSGNIALTVLADFDGDGMADRWETNYFGAGATNDSANALADSDGDGMVNRDEYVAGTHPLDASSVLRLSLTSLGSGVEFVAQSNIAYVVQYQTNLGPVGWNTVTNVAGQSLMRTIQVHAPNPPPEGERYYRIVTPPPWP